MKHVADWYQRIFRVLAISTFCVVLIPGTAHSKDDDYIERYGLTPNSPSVDLGVQPLGYPSGVISAVMQHDRILRKALADKHQPLKAHPFRRGADMVPLFMDRRLEAGLLGDMPTILAASSGKVWIVGLVKNTSTAIVAAGTTQTRELAGKRIGFVETSSAHHTLLQGLASAGLQETQVKLVPLRVDEMPSALERGEIDAFAAWEPAPSTALKNNSRNRIVFRGLSTDYFVLDRQFAKSHPEAARHLVAGFARAIEWMRRSQKNLAKASQWAITESESFSGKRESLSLEQVALITRREILNIPSAPSIVMSGDTYSLVKEYDFLTRLGKLPTGAKLDHLRDAFSYAGLADVLKSPHIYKVLDFDYED